ncbi:hypothetical protein PLICRDRAFT_49089 [Plicaturopsis crispa FD-325 SS-3]|nr:hypothetical protein PLICRDRAFT_49089 [Plicaturopsis crispa FD-325 SS-3]
MFSSFSICRPTLAVPLFAFLAFLVTLPTTVSAAPAPWPVPQFGRPLLHVYGVMGPTPFGPISRTRTATLGPCQLATASSDPPAAPTEVSVTSSAASAVATGTILVDAIDSVSGLPADATANESSQFSATSGVESVTSTTASPSVPTSSTSDECPIPAPNSASLSESNGSTSLRSVGSIPIIVASIITTYLFI